MAAAYRIPEDEMVLVIINPETKRPISPVTLRKHFAEELKTGFVTGRMRIMAASLRSAIGYDTTVDGQTKHVPGNVTAQIWLQKVLYGLRETTEVMVPAGTAAAAQAMATDGEEPALIEGARRVAFLLAQGARALTTGSTQPGRKKAGART